MNQLLEYALKLMLKEPILSVIKPIKVYLYKNQSHKLLVFFPMNRGALHSSSY